MSDYQDVLFSEVKGVDGDIGVMTLNRPDVLNSLNHSMIHAMHKQLKEWAVKSSIKAVVIRAVEGRAFCAGGDLRLTHERSLAKHPARTDFFYDEYQLNKCIFHYPKPYIAFLDGITMGGGVGISIHGSHRVATDKLLFAMPETGIGFFPDVGGTYFLPRLPGFMGYYLGLTGARLKIDDALQVGVVTHKVDSSSLPDLLQSLADTPFTGDAKQAVTTIIQPFTVTAQPSTLMQEKAHIDQCFAKTSMEDIVAALQQSTATICNEAVTMLAKKSPTSLKVTLHAFELAKSLNFDQIMQQEYRLSTHFLNNHDFIEGIRAVIIDKDQKPHWKPATLQEVSVASVDAYFGAVERELV
jgi:enoyl-CoA hydratase